MYSLEKTSSSTDVSIIAGKFLLGFSWSTLFVLLSERTANPLIETLKKKISINKLLKSKVHLSLIRYQRMQLVH